MNVVWEAVAIAGWAVLLLNLLLTMRLVRWLRSYQDADRLDNFRADLPELPVGEPAPAFLTRDISGRIVKSEDFPGREVAIVFVSPHCGICRREMPGLVTLAAVAGKTAGAEIILVSDGGAGEVESWLADISAEHKVDIALPVLMASARTSDFQVHYNPRALTPYFCHIDRTGVVTARGGLHTPAWAALVRRWDPAAGPDRNSQNSRRYW